MSDFIPLNSDHVIVAENEAEDENDFFKEFILNPDLNDDKRGINDILAPNRYDFTTNFTSTFNTDNQIELNSTIPNQKLKDKFNDNINQRYEMYAVNRPSKISKNITKSYIQSIFEQKSITGDVFFVADTSDPNILEDLQKNNSPTQNFYWTQIAQTLYDPATKITAATNAGSRYGFNTIESKFKFCWETIDTGRQITCYPEWEDNKNEFEYKDNNPETMFFSNRRIYMGINKTQLSSPNTKYDNFNSGILITYPKTLGLYAFCDKKMASIKNTDIGLTDEAITNRNQLKQFLESAIKNIVLTKEQTTNQSNKFLSKRLGDSSQALACLRKNIPFQKYSDPSNKSSAIENFRSNGNMAFISFDRIAIGAALTYNVPIVIHDVRSMQTPSQMTDIETNARAIHGTNYTNTTETIVAEDENMDDDEDETETPTNGNKMTSIGFIVYIRKDLINPFNNLENMYTQNIFNKAFTLVKPYDTELKQNELKTQIENYKKNIENSKKIFEKLVLPEASAIDLPLRDPTKSTPSLEYADKTFRNFLMFYNSHIFTFNMCNNLTIELNSDTYNFNLLKTTMVNEINKCITQLNETMQYPGLTFTAISPITDIDENTTNYILNDFYTKILQKENSIYPKIYADFNIAENKPIISNYLNNIILKINDCIGILNKYANEFINTIDIITKINGMYDKLYSYSIPDTITGTLNSDKISSYLISDPYVEDVFNSKIENILGITISETDVKKDFKKDDTDTSKQNWMIALNKTNFDIKPKKPYSQYIANKKLPRGFDATEYCTTRGEFLLLDTVIIPIFKSIVAPSLMDIRQMFSDNMQKLLTYFQININHYNDENTGVLNTHFYNYINDQLTKHLIIPTPPISPVSTDEPLTPPISPTSIDEPPTPPISPTSIDEPPTNITIDILKQYIRNEIGSYTKQILINIIHYFDPDVIITNKTITQLIPIFKQIIPAKTTPSKIELKLNNLLAYLIKSLNRKELLINRTTIIHELKVIFEDTDYTKIVGGNITYFGGEGDIVTETTKITEFIKLLLSKDFKTKYEKFDAEFIANIFEIDEFLKGFLILLFKMHMENILFSANSIDEHVSKTKRDTTQPNFLEYYKSVNIKILEQIFKTFYPQDNETQKLSEKLEPEYTYISTYYTTSFIDLFQKSTINRKIYKYIEQNNEYVKYNTENDTIIITQIGKNDMSDDLNTFDYKQKELINLDPNAENKAWSVILLPNEYFENFGLMQIIRLGLLPILLTRIEMVMTYSKDRKNSDVQYIDAGTNVINNLINEKKIIINSPQFYGKVPQMITPPTQSPTIKVGNYGGSRKKTHRIRNRKISKRSNYHMIRKTRRYIGQNKITRKYRK